MDALLDLITPTQLVLACGIAVLAGLVKGVVGFGMPMVLVSGLTTFIPADVAIAGLILPTVVTNGMQALRQGPRAAAESVNRFRIFLIFGFVALVMSAQLVSVLPNQTLLLMIGLPVVCFALLQLSGITFEMPRRKGLVEASIGSFAGFIGGLSGIWGPPTVAYLTALKTEKHDQMRVQGVIYGLGAVALLGAHVVSGVLRGATLPLSLALIPSAVVGVWVGRGILDRIDQRMFARVTLCVLLVSGANLVRRGLLG